MSAETLSRQCIRMKTRYEDQGATAVVTIMYQDHIDMTFM